MLELIESTLSTSRLDEGRVEMKSRPVDLAAVVRTVCEHQSELSDELDLHVALDGLPETIEGDPALLDQVFTNLLSNAVKYAPSEPRITVTGACQSAGTVSVAISDNGVGIPEDDMEHLFDRFFRASTSEGISGTGIGLNLALSLIHI